MRLSVVSAAFAFALPWAAAGCLGDAHAPSSSTSTTARTATVTVAAAPSCSPPQVAYTPYPGRGDGLGQIPWIRGEPRDSGLVALLWYWPRNWQRRELREARIFTGGVAPAGYNVKVMWVFLGRAARGRAGSELVVEGRRLDGPGTFRDSFPAIGYAGQGQGPAYASIIDVPNPGCWRLNLTTGALRGHVVFRAVKGKS
jgi:hypothetical protein